MGLEEGPAWLDIYFYQLDRSSSTFRMIKDLYCCSIWVRYRCTIFVNLKDLKIPDMKISAENN